MTGKTFILVLIILSSTFSLFGTTPSEKIEENDKYIQRVMDRYGLPGVSMAVVKDDKVIHRKNFGYANLEHRVPVTDKSIFRAYSTTKLFVAVSFFKLIDEGKLSLDDPVDKFFKELPKGWENRKLIHLITHSSGFPDMAPIPDFEGLNEKQAVAKVFAKPIESSPGVQYSYNQTAFWMLRKIISEVSGKSFEDFVLDGQTGGKQTGAFFSTDSRDIIPNRATAYFPFESGYRQIAHPAVQPFLSAANGLNISMDEFLKWDRRLRKRQLVSDASVKKMWTPYVYQKKRLFGHGWGIYQNGPNKSYGFTGSFVTAYRHYPSEDMTIIILGNGMGQFFNIDSIVDYVAGIFEPKLMNPALVGSEKLIIGMLEGDVDSTIDSFPAIKRSAPNANFEGTLNSLGYALMNQKRLKDAIKVFELNTREYPKSGNVWDSLGEAYFNAKKYEIALKHYKKSVELDPTSENGKKMVASIEALIKKQ